MKNLSISKKMFVGFGIVLILMIMTIVASIYSISSITKQVELYGKYTLPNNDSVWIMRRNLVSAQRYLLHAMTEDDAQSAQAFLDLAQKDGQGILDELEKYKNNQRNHSRDEQLAELGTLFNQAGSVRREIAAVIVSQDPDRLSRAQIMFDDQYVPPFDQAAEILIGFSESSAKNAAQQKLDAENAQKLAWVLLISLSAIAIIGSIILGVIISRSISVPINKLAENAKKLAAGDTDADFEIHTREEVGMLASAFREVIGTLKHMVSDANLLVEAAAVGDLHVRADGTKNQGDFRKIIEGVNKTLDVLVGHIDNISAPVMIVDRDFGIRYMNKTGAGLLGRTQAQLIGEKCYDQFKTSDCKTENCACMRAMRDNTRAISETDAHPNGMNLDISYIGVPVKDDSGSVIGALEIVTDMTEIKTAQRLADKRSKYQSEHIDRLVVNLERLARGELECDMKVTPSDQDTQALFELFSNVSDNLHSSMDAIKGYIGEVAKVLAEVSDGNLRIGIHRDYMGEFVQIKKSINSIIGSLNKVLGEINTAAEQVSTGASQVSSGAQALASGSTEQASSIEQLSASAVIIADQAEDNSVNVKTATQFVEQVSTSVKDGSEHMKQLTEAMENIGTSSNQITEITGAIEDIAFQTNILALNAAIEAARAGDAGKGFAVVADEVRNLAAKSAEAAKQTAELIHHSVVTVNEGSKITARTAEILKTIEEKTNQVNEIINKINKASNEQTVAIDQVKQGLNQVSSVVQTNAATAEENSATSEEMSAQAVTLREEVGKFQLDVGHETDGYSAGPMLKSLPKENRYQEERISLETSYDFGKY